MTECWLKNIVGHDLLDRVTGLCKAINIDDEFEGQLLFNIELCPHVKIHYKDFDTPYYCKRFQHPEIDEPQPRDKDEFADLCETIGR